MTRILIRVLSLPFISLRSDTARLLFSSHRLLRQYGCIIFELPYTGRSSRSGSDHGKAPKLFYALSANIRSRTGAGPRVISGVDPSQ
jgi:hypothetical protein